MVQKAVWKEVIFRLQKQYHQNTDKRGCEKTEFVFSHPLFTPFFLDGYFTDFFNGKKMYIRSVRNFLFWSKKEKALRIFKFLNEKLNIV